MTFWVMGSITPDLMRVLFIAYGPYKITMYHWDTNIISRAPQQYWHCNLKIPTKNTRTLLLR
jgi:hypothetical protein